MPLCGLTNDNFIGREKHVRDAPPATKMLASIARCCFKQVRLGKGSPDAQQKGICGNAIYFAQPTAEVPSLILPPEDGALAESHLNIIFTKSVEDFSSAHWATVSREEYLRIVRERKRECAAFANVTIDMDAAERRLPDDGVPVSIAACAARVDGIDRAPVNLTGPECKTPAVGKDEGAGDESEEGASYDGQIKDDAAAPPEAAFHMTTSQPPPLRWIHYIRSLRCERCRQCKHGWKQSRSMPRPLLETRRELKLKTPMALCKKFHTKADEII